MKVRDVIKGGFVVEYTVMIEKGPNSYGASVPDLPGCIAVAETKEELLVLIKEAIELHLQGMREDNETIPIPSIIAAVGK